MNVRAGQSPPVDGSPGSFAENSTIPPVIQNLFHPCNMADCMYLESTKNFFVFSLKALYTFSFCSVVMLRTPFVVIALS